MGAARELRPHRRGAALVPGALRPIFLLGLPAQHLDQGARGQPGARRGSAATRWRSGSRAGRPRPGATWAAKAPPGSARRRSRATSTSSQNLGDGDLLPQRPLGDARAVRPRRASTSPTRSSTTTPVAMTGGQPVDGPISLPEITRQGRPPRAPSASSFVTDEPEKYPVGTDFAPGVTIRTRDELDAVQRELPRGRRHDGPRLRPDLRRREAPSPQARPLPRTRPSASSSTTRCARAAATARTSRNCRLGQAARDRARTQAPDRPVETATRTSPASRAFCPSFVTVHGGAPAQGEARSRRRWRRIRSPPFPCPLRGPLGEPYVILPPSTGIRRHRGSSPSAPSSAWRAHLEGKGCSVLDFTGRSRKRTGAVMSHIRLAAAARGHPRRAHRRRRRQSAARLRHGGGGKPGGAVAHRDRRDARRRSNGALVPTRRVRHETATFDFEAAAIASRAARCRRQGRGGRVTAPSSSTRHRSPPPSWAIRSRPTSFMLGYAHAERALVPLSVASIERGDRAQTASPSPPASATFAWGRLAAHDRAAVEAQARPAIREEPAPAGEPCRQSSPSAPRC